MGQQFWENTLNLGVRRDLIVQGFLQSQESAELATASFYAAFLHRPIDPIGDAVWTRFLTSNVRTFGQVAANFFFVLPREFATGAETSIT